jgi:hypothetical protein
MLIIQGHVEQPQLGSRRIERIEEKAPIKGQAMAGTASAGHVCSWQCAAKAKSLVELDSTQRLSIGLVTTRLGRVTRRAGASCQRPRESVYQGMLRRAIEVMKHVGSLH